MNAVLLAIVRLAAARPKTALALALIYLAIHLSR